MTLQNQSGGMVEVHVSGKLDREDYRQAVPELERLIDRHGKVRMLVDMSGFHGWTAGALWEDIKFDARHFSHFERIALVGEKKWQKGMSKFCRRSPPPKSVTSITTGSRKPASGRRRELKADTNHREHPSG